MAFKYTSGSPTGTAFFVPAGTYTVRVAEAIEDTSKSGNDMLKLKLRIVLNNGHDGPALFDYLVLSEGASWKIDQFLAAMGKHPGEGRAVELDPDIMIGWECDAELVVDEYNGKQSNKVSAYIISEY